LRSGDVVVKKQAVKQAVKAVPKRDAAKQTFTMRHLWRMTLWGATASSALFVAVLTTRSEVGSQRMAAMFSPARTQLAARPVDPQAETRRLAAAVHDLTAENGQLKARLAAVERNMDDITGSVARQIEAVKAQTAAPWPADAEPGAATPAAIASIVAPTVPSSGGFGAPLLTHPPAVTAPPHASAEAGLPADAPTQYGVDIGSALSIEALRARWLGVRSAHAQLFGGLTPTVVLRQLPRSERAELRLVVGPLASSAAAVQLCAALAPYRLFCQPTVFDRQHVALQ
jgi:hypothetical protein